MAEITTPEDLFEALSELTDDLKVPEEAGLTDEQEKEFNLLLDAFMQTEREMEKKKKKQNKENSRHGYKLCCCVDDDPSEHLVEGFIKEIKPDWGLYVHVDLVLPDVDEQNTLTVNVTAIRGKGEIEGRFDPETIALFRDGNHLHLKPTLLTDFFGSEYKLSKDEDDILYLILSKNGETLSSYRIAIKGPWPTSPKPDGYTIDNSINKDLTVSQELIHQKIGWTQFKSRMDEMVSRWQVGTLRDRAGLSINKPKLHTIIMGNPGSGKSTCVGQMVRLYKEMGLLTSDKTVPVRLSSLASSNVNGEYDNVLSAASNADGGTLVFENAHELFRTEKGNGYDTEQRIIRALIEVLENETKYPIMMVLTGEPDGLESLLAANPDLKKHFNAPIYLDDFNPEELFTIAQSHCRVRELLLTPDAEAKLKMYLLHKYNHRGEGFQNAWMVKELIDEHIIPAMYNRLMDIPHPDDEQLEMIEAQDIPMVSSSSGHEMAELDELIGLGKIKTKVKDYLNAIQLAGRRMELGLPTSMPRLHMAFLGNPGTGKTTVANIIGKVFASWGILSGGRVIRTEKSQMVGQWIGETEQKMRALLERARGNILFIDEAYQLVEGGEKDFGRIVMNSLLTELGKENADIVVILAGYTAPMKQLLASNDGIESRFPNVFNFEDFTPDELVEIGKLMIKKQGFILTPGAEANMRTIIEEEAEKPSPRFGNGRFISNLLQNEILATLGARTAAIKNPTKEELSTILPEDVVIGKAQKDVVFDDVAIDAALARLDALAGLSGIKAAIHNFVKSARYLHSIGEPYVGKGLLSWRFIGKSGTGKSTVAEIMASILKGMRLIANSHITEIKGERLLGAYDETQDILQDAVKKSCNGLIFIDMDGTMFNDDRTRYGRLIEQILLKLKEMTIEAGGECALIMAELDAPNVDMAEHLSDAGIYDFDHTLIFRDYTSGELYDTLCYCLKKFEATITPEAEAHIRGYLNSLSASIETNARTMKLMARTIHQQVILREAGLPERPAVHQVELADVKTFKLDKKKGKIGF